MYGNYSRHYDMWSKCYDLEFNEMKILNQYIDWRNKTILEIGCGTGRFTQRIAPLAKRILSIDNDYISVEYAKDNYPFKNVEYLVLNALDIEKITEKFDIIVFSWSYNYILNAAEAMLKAINKLKMLGSIIVLYTWLGDYELMCRSIRAGEPLTIDNYEAARNLMAQANMELIEDKIECFFSFRTLQDALDNNTFFYSLEKDGPLSLFEIETLKRKLVSYQNSKDEIQIKDLVKLLIGKRRN